MYVSSAFGSLHPITLPRALKLFFLFPECYSWDHAFGLWPTVLLGMLDYRELKSGSGFVSQPSGESCSTQCTHRNSKAVGGRHEYHWGLLAVCGRVWHTQERGYELLKEDSQLSKDFLE